jgi:WhiB family redox-sensing transcriptional regulator
MTARQRHRVLPLWPTGEPNPAGPEPWMAFSLCKETDPEAFFPEKGQSTAYAKKVCRRCPVTAECLRAALERDERFGIWGGLSERERRKLKKPACEPSAPGSEEHAGASKRVTQADAAKQRRREYAACRSEGMSNAAASFAVGVSKWTGQQYARDLKCQAASGVADEHPWRQGSAVLPKLEATA